MKDLEQERDVLHQGLDLLDKCRSWYKEELLRIKEQQHQLISGKVSGRGRWRRIWGGCGGGINGRTDAEKALQSRIGGYLCYSTECSRFYKVVLCVSKLLRNNQPLFHKF